MKINKESILYFFIPHIIFIVLVTIADDVEIAVALLAQAIASALILGFLIDFCSKRIKVCTYDWQYSSIDLSHVKLINLYVLLQF